MICCRSWRNFANQDSTKDTRTAFLLNQENENRVLERDNGLSHEDHNWGTGKKELG